MSYRPYDPMTFGVSKKSPFKKYRSYRSKTVSPMVKQYVKKEINKNIENKYLETALTGVFTGGIPSAGTLYNVNILSQGTAVNTRVGNRVKWSSIRLKGVFGYADADNIVRMMVLWARAPLSIGNMPDVYSPINPGSQDYQILYDTTRVLDSTAASGIRYKSIGPIIRKINGNSTYDDASTTPTAGFLYIYAVSDSSISSHPSFTGSCICSFQDA